ncbi:uncharacterized protein B0H18DRAFT_846600, partial [Fomitopsis serialis]|uniref:uncharacterized protein n=1 Tax=Fomitopsis serialis TaxID=139415 RepID=UPI002007FF53
AITINALWFVALVLSLGAASIAINVKQWLTNYVAPDTVDAYQRVRLWSLRHHGLMAWNVPEIIALLPLLLQSALTFFLAGLLVLLWTLDIAVACCVAVPVAALLSFSGATLAIPALAADCPYRSPQAW